MRCRRAAAVGALARFLARAPAVPTRPPPPLSLSLTHMYVLCFAVVFVLYFALLRGARRRSAATELGARASGRISCLCPRRSEVQALPSPLQGMPALPAPAAPIAVFQSQLQGRKCVILNGDVRTTCARKISPGITGCRDDSAEATAVDRAGERLPLPVLPPSPSNVQSLHVAESTFGFGGRTRARSEPFPCLPVRPPGPPTDGPGCLCLPSLSVASAMQVGDVVRRSERGKQEAEQSGLIPRPPDIWE